MIKHIKIKETKTYNHEIDIEIPDDENNYFNYVLGEIINILQPNNYKELCNMIKTEYRNALFVEDESGHTSIEVDCD